MEDKKSQLKAIGRFLHDFPEIKGYWKERVLDELYDPNNRLPTCELGEVAHYIVENLEDATVVKKALGKIEEHFLDNQNEDVKNLGSSLIEDLINVLENNGHSSNIIEPYLGQLRKQAFSQINSFWLNVKS